jgi:hypothetical protein
MARSSVEVSGYKSFDGRGRRRWSHRAEEELTMKRRTGGQRGGQAMKTIDKGRRNGVNRRSHGSHSPITGPVGKVHRQVHWTLSFSGLHGTS